MNSLIVPSAVLGAKNCGKKRKSPFPCGGNMLRGTDGFQGTILSRDLWPLVCPTGSSCLLRVNGCLLGEIFLVKEPSARFLTPDFHLLPHANTSSCMLSTGALTSSHVATKHHLSNLPWLLTTEIPKPALELLLLKQEAPPKLGRGYESTGPSL